MKFTNVDSLYGLKIGDKVQYIANNEKDYNKLVFNKIGEVKKIVAATGEFIVGFDDLHFDVSFQRPGLLLLDESNKEIVEFNGVLTETTTLNSSEIRGYLTKYHDFVEGSDFSVSTRDDVNEIMLLNDKFASMIKDLIDIQKVNREFLGTASKDFKHTIKPAILYGEAVSVSFKIANWTFRTHLTPWTVQHSFLLNYNINLYEEWGFTNI